MLQIAGLEAVGTPRLNRHEPALPAACAIFRSWREGGCSIRAAVSSAHDPKRTCHGACHGIEVELAPLTTTDLFAFILESVAFYRDWVSSWPRWLAWVPAAFAPAGQRRDHTSRRLPGVHAETAVELPIFYQKCSSVATSIHPDACYRCLARPQNSGVHVRGF